MNALIRPKTLLVLGLMCGMTTAVLYAVEPSWWVARGVRDPAKAASDYGALNQGQLKNFARGARDEMNEKLPGGAGEEINALVDSWSNDTVNAADYALVNLGQLKTVAKPYYERMGLSAPWIAPNPNTADYASANIGQAKALFAFEIDIDTDGDGLFDQQELAMRSRIDQADTDGDGVLDGQEWLSGSDLLNAPGAEAALRLVVLTPLEASSTAQ